MKLKQMLPFGLLAVLALVGCDGNPSDSSSSVDESSSEEPVETLGSYADGLAVGVQGEGVLEDIVGLLPAADGLVNRAVQEYHDYLSIGASDPDNATVGDRTFAYEDYAVYDVKRYDNDVLSVSLDSQSKAPEYVEGTGYGEWPEEFSPVYTAEASLWQDETKLHYVYEEDGDPSNAYSFAAEADKNDELLAAYLDTVGASGDINSGIALAEEAYAYYAPTYVASGFNYLSKTVEVEKVAAAGENPAHTIVTYETHLGYYLSGELAWGIAGLYAERYYAWGIQFVIADGIVAYAYLDTGTMWQAEYVDSAATPVTPVVVESPWMTNEEWATYVTGSATVALDAIVFGSYFTYYETVYTTASNGDFASADLPNVALYRAADASDVGMWINLELLSA